MNSNNTRCLRCGTLLRNGRNACPSCGLGLGEDESNEAPKAAASSHQSARPAPRPVAAKSGVRMCPVCMATVAEIDLSDVKGQLICNPCAVALLSKEKKKQAV